MSDRNEYMKEYMREYRAKKRAELESDRQELADTEDVEEGQENDTEQGVSLSPGFLIIGGLIVVLVAYVCYSTYRETHPKKDKVTPSTITVPGPGDR